MNTPIEKNVITKRINKIFLQKFNVDLFGINEKYYMDDNILDKKFNLYARDLLYLVYDLEQEFDIKITSEDLDEIRLNTVRNIILLIQKKSNMEEVSI